MKLLLIIGEERVGKSTLARQLVKTSPNKTTHLPIADSIRGDLMMQLNVDYDCFWQDPKPKGMRELLVGHGTLMKTLHGSHYWGKRFVEAATATEADWVIADDLRFFSEYDAIAASNQFDEISIVYLYDKSPVCKSGEYQIGPLVRFFNEHPTVGLTALSRLQAKDFTWQMLEAGWA